MTNGSAPSPTKQAVLDRLAEEQAIWDALIAEVPPAWAVEPDAMGEWSFKDVVAHLTGWRQPLVNDIVAVVQGTPPARLDWPFTRIESEDPTHGEARTQAINDWLFDQNRDRNYDQVLAEASLQWTLLRAAVDLIPDDLVERRGVLANLYGDSLAGAMLGPDAFGHFHEEHETGIRTWLADRRAAG